MLRGYSEYSEGTPRVPLVSRRVSLREGTPSTPRVLEGNPGYSEGTPGYPEYSGGTPGYCEYSEGARQRHIGGDVTSADHLPLLVPCEYLRYPRSTCGTLRVLSEYPRVPSKCSLCAVLIIVGFIGLVVFAFTTARGADAAWPLLLLGACPKSTLGSTPRVPREYPESTPRVPREYFESTRRMRGAGKQFFAYVQLAAFASQFGDSWPLAHRWLFWLEKAFASGKRAIPLLTWYSQGCSQGYSQGYSQGCSQGCSQGYSQAHRWLFWLEKALASGNGALPVLTGTRSTHGCSHCTLKVLSGVLWRCTLGSGILSWYLHGYRGAAQCGALRGTHGCFLRR